MYLVTRHNGNLLRGPVTPKADIDQVDAEPLQPSPQQDGLPDATLQPLPVRPICSAGPYEERSF